MTEFTVRNLMTASPALIGPESTLYDAAKQMERINCGVLPVGSAAKLVGMITDRDIVLRAIARGKDPARIKVSEVMTNKIFSVAEDASLQQAADIMKNHKVNRLIVKDDQGNITGIFSLSGLIREAINAQAISQFAEHLAANYRTAA